MELHLKEKVIVVTGGAKGIGQGIVNVLAREGALPVIVGRNEADNIQAVDRVVQAGGKAFQVTAELTRPDECERAARSILD
ncbi:MAG: SDR family NAD(P)-dependent oxidoreductase, partial [Cyclobacteriaceae bacterium]|nr:SDR family NAD(P)-dependent oxidoreductase [Cyclobacteriaceae bacterium]